jgi:hypothetical protein
MTDLRPPAPRPLPPERLAARRDHLVRELRAGRPRRRWLPRGRRAFLLVPIGAVLVAGGALATSQLWQASHPEDLARVKCYAGANVNAHYREASADIFGARGPAVKPKSRTAMCAQLWRHGVLGDGHSAPPLQACVYRAEAVVFPGPEGTCEALGLRRPRGSYTRQQRRGLVYVDRLAAVLEQCGDPKQISREIDRIVRRAFPDREPPHLTIRLRPGQRCGPALSHREAMRFAPFIGPITGSGFYPPAYMGCVESYGAIEKAPGGTNCFLGLGAVKAPECPDGPQAERIVRRALDRHGLTDWRIVVVPPESLSSHFCYVFSRVHPSLKEVRLSSRRYG